MRNLVGGSSQRRLAVVLALWPVLLLPASAADITVDGECTLTQAIVAANLDTTVGTCPAGSGADTLTLARDVTLLTPYGGGYPLQGLPTISSEIIIEGGDYTISRDTSAVGFRLFTVADVGDLTLRNTTISGGRGGPFSQGGGIRSSGALTLIETRVVGNWAAGGGGVASSDGNIVLVDSLVVDNGGYWGGGIDCSSTCSTVSLTNSTVAGNTAGSGGGIRFFGTTATVTDSEIVNNNASESGGGMVAGGSVTLSNSTVSGNTAWESGGGISNLGSLSLLNSTVSSNTAASRGGGVFSDGDLTVVHSTLANNVAGIEGGGVYSYAYYAYYSPPAFTGSLLAANTPQNCAAAGGILDYGDNRADDISCGTISDDLIGLELSLADNGGPTWTHALLAGSNALDNAGSCGLASDQRGASRSDGNCDSGAFEFIPCPDLVLSDSTILGTETHENCQRILVGPNLDVAGSGDLTVRAGKTVVLVEGTSVDTACRLAVEIDPDLQLVPP